MLDRFSLLYSNENEPVFFGPGFIELRYQLPLIWLAIIAIVGSRGLGNFLYFFGKTQK